MKTATETRRRAAAVAEHRDQFGDWCPGYGRRPAHDVDPLANPLTADHVDAVGAGGSEGGPLTVLCRSCNSGKRDR